MRGVAQSLGVVVFLSAGVAQGQPRSATLEARAQEQYQVGRERYRASEFERAREAFTASLQMVDSPNTRMYLGRSLRQIGHMAEAYALLDRAALDAGERARTEPRYSATRDSARVEADALLSRLSMLTVSVSGELAGAVVRVNGSELPRGVWGARVPMEPGALRVVLGGDHVREEARSLELVAGGAEVVSFVVERSARVAEPEDRGIGGVDGVTVNLRAGAGVRREAPSGGGSWRTAGVVTMLSGGAVLGGALAFGLLALSGYNLLDGLKLSGRNNSNDPLIAQGETYRDVSNGLVVLGGSLFAAGLTFWFVGRFARNSGARGGVALSLDPRGTFGLAGTF